MNSKSYCEDCHADAEDVQPVELKFGFGRTRTRWGKVQHFCRGCRKKRPGFWRKAPGFTVARTLLKLADPALTCSI